MQIGILFFFSCHHQNFKLFGAEYDGEIIIIIISKSWNTVMCHVGDGLTENYTKNLFWMGGWGWGDDLSHSSCEFIFVHNCRGEKSFVCLHTNGPKIDAKYGGDIGFDDNVHFEIKFAQKKNNCRRQVAENIQLDAKLHKIQIPCKFDETTLRQNAKNYKLCKNAQNIEFHAKMHKTPDLTAKCTKTVKTSIKTRKSHWKLKTMRKKT